MIGPFCVVLGGLCPLLGSDPDPAPVVVVLGGLGRSLSDLAVPVAAVHGLVFVALVVMGDPVVVGLPLGVAGCRPRRSLLGLPGGDSAAPRSTDGLSAPPFMSDGLDFDFDLSWS